MKHNLRKIIYVSFLVLGILSCRQEEVVEESKNEEKTFRLFNKENYKQYKNSQENSSLSRLYALDFLQAYYSYDLKNGTNYTGFNIKGSVPTSYINFRVHSQVIEDKEGNIYMYFPVIKNEKVFDIYFSSINKENTLLGLYKLNNNAEEYNDIFSAFEKVFVHPNEKIFSRSGDVTDVGEVVIVGPSKPTNGTGITGPGQCEMYGQCNNPGGGSGSSGGSGGGGGTPAVPNKDIIDKLKDFPCAQSLLKQLPDMNNELAKALKNIFQNNDNYRITFKPMSGLGNVDGITNSVSRPDSNTFFATISLNDNMLRNATKEYILITMYHEVIHAYLAYELHRLGQSKFEEEYPVYLVGADYGPNGTIINRFGFKTDHQNVGFFLGTLENTLSTYNPSLPNETVKAMVKAGITTTTPTEKTLNNNERDTTQGRNKGTKCSN